MQYSSHTRWARSRRMDGGEYKWYWCSDTWREARKSMYSRKSLRVVANPSIAGTLYNEISILLWQWEEQSLDFESPPHISKRITKICNVSLFGLEMRILRMLCVLFSQKQSLFYPSIAFLGNNLNSLFRELHAMCYGGRTITNLIDEVQKRWRR